MAGPHQALTHTAPSLDTTCETVVQDLRPRTTTAPAAFTVPATVECRAKAAKLDDDCIKLDTSLNIPVRSAIRPTRALTEAP